MRWERLFAEIEAQSADDALAERDELAREIAAGDWARTSWRHLLAGAVVLEVKTLGRVEGDVLLINDRVVHLRSPAGDLVVDAGAVVGVLASEGRAIEPGVVQAALGWGHVLRALAAEREPVGFHRTDGTALVGIVDVVGQDFVRVAEENGRTRLLPFAALVAVRSRS